MTISRKLTSITTAIALAAASLGAVSTTASAGGYRGGEGYYGGGGYGGGGRHYSRSYDGGYRGDYGHRGGRDRYYARKKKNNTGKYIAIGAAALMLGIIASEASRR
ncbi:MAG: hypothetical protein H7Y62_14600 [Hyphomicrobium sp.]|nr:hypothetical protein [Hyphomicrobium sp.]